jgi:hypothetical protein
MKCPDVHEGDCCPLALLIIQNFFQQIILGNSVALLVVFTIILYAILKRGDITKKMNTEFRARKSQLVTYIKERKTF